MTVKEVERFLSRHSKIEEVIRWFNNMIFTLITDNTRA